MVRNCSKRTFQHKSALDAFLAPVYLPKKQNGSLTRRSQIFFACDYITPAAPPTNDKKEPQPTNKPALAMRMVMTQTQCTEQFSFLTSAGECKIKAGRRKRMQLGSLGRLFVHTCKTVQQQDTSPVSWHLKLWLLSRCLLFVLEFKPSLGAQKLEEQH